VSYPRGLIVPVSYRLLRAPAPTAAVALDDAQRTVTAHREGALLVMGGPGTGKTTTLVEAVAARVDEGVPPDRILALTFGRRMAGRLRDRVEARVARRASAEPLVRTFHAYAFGILRRVAAEFGDPPPRLLTAPEQDLIIRELVAAEPEAWPESLRPALRSRAFATQLRDLLMRCAERGVPADELAALGSVHGRADWPVAARFMREYVQVLALRYTTTRSGVAYDSAELLRAAAGLLRAEPELLAIERRRLSHVYVDELHDTDPAQLDLLELIAGDGANLVAFADPDSSTFAFRGADPAGVYQFADRFHASTTYLTRAYRPHPELLRSTLRVASRLRGPVRHRLLSAVDDPGGSAQAEPGAEVHTFRSATSEAAYVAHRLRAAHLIDGVPWSRMAVIVRSTRLALASLQRALHQAGIPTTTHAEDLPLSVHPAVTPLLLAMRCALEPERLDEDAAVALLHSPLGGADPMAERRLRQGLRALALAAGDRRPSGPLLVDALRDPGELVAVERRWAEPARRVARLLGVVQEAAARPGATAEDTLWALWEASGLADRWAAASARGGHRGAAADRDLDAIMVLFDTVARFTDRLPGAGTEVFLDQLLGEELPGDSRASVADRGPAVRILTAHAAKGLEWDVVLIPGVQEGVWPDLRLRGSVLGSEQLVDVLAGRELGAVGQTAALLEEERRLFYVAVTRARRRVIATAVASGDGEEQPSRFLYDLSGEDPQEHPASTRLPRALTLPALVAELRGAVADPDLPPDRRQAAAAHLAELAAAGVAGADPDEWWGLPPLSDERPLRDEDQAVVVTPSNVESVQRCSLRWLLERHGGGARPTPEQGVGNLVHAAAMLAGEVNVDRAALVEYVSGRFDEIELTARWLAGRERDRAEQMIDKLVGWVAANPRKLAAIEAEFLVQLDEVTRIRGRVDRLEIDEHGRLVVIDLKTGKTTSVTEADLPTHPQLAAYQAAVEAGAFEEFGTESGGAALVQLGTNVGVKEQVQPPLSKAADPEWAQAMVKRTAATMAASTFLAVVNSKCRNCPVRTSCPVGGRGRQVTDETGRPRPGPLPRSGS
jgi:superfamily I DNA/RNA helicase/RecB family exonuclease